MIRTPLLLSLLRWAACLKRVEWSPPSMKFDLWGDGFNYTLDMENVVFEEEEILALKDEVREPCRDYPRGTHLERREADAGSMADEGVEVNASKIESLGKNLKAVCFGTRFDGEKCRKATGAIRYAVWARLRSDTGSLPIFAYLRARASPPTMKSFRHSGGVMTDLSCGHGSGQAHLYYRHIYKSAGMAIKENLAILGKHDPEDFKDWNWNEYGWCDSYVQKKQTGVVPQPVLFTFVRDPMEKFIAGFKEVSSRGFVDTVRGKQVGTIEHAKYFLDNVFHGSCDDGHVLLQLQSMMGPACESRFDFVGRLEDFESQWHELGAHAGCAEELVWPHDYHHASDDDDKGSDKAMRAALADNGGQLMRVLCLWLLPDYIAFDYPLPDECKGQGFLHG